jgi:hypothetical protein
MDSRTMDSRTMDSGVEKAWDISVETFPITE